MKLPRASLILSTYEMPRALELVTEGLLRQTTHDFEVWICDDGSGGATRAVVEQFRARAAAHFKVEHLWQENQGFRKCRILNRALQKSRGELSIFLDGDCIPHPEFIADHLAASTPGTYSAGRRVELGEQYSSRLTPESVRAGVLDWPRLDLLRSFQRGDSQYLNRMLRITSPRLRHLLKLNRVHDLKGCNYSVARSDLVAINGFDAAFEGYGREDTDVELRLQHLGLKIRSLKGMALQYHVWHPRRAFTPQNDTRLDALRNSQRVRCEQGLDQVTEET